MQVMAKEKCQKIVKEQEFKIRKLKEKMAGIAPTKKNKARMRGVGCSRLAHAGAEAQKALHAGCSEEGLVGFDWNWYHCLFGIGWFGLGLVRFGA